MLKRLGLIIFSVLYWLWFILTHIIYIPIAFVIWIITLPFDKRLVILHQFSCFWGHSYMWLNPLWSFKMTGRKNIKRGKTYVIISNHQSMLDIVVLYGLFRHYKWVSKKENFSIPIIGWLMRMNRYIEIDRGSTGTYLGMMRKISATLKGGSSVMMFPEGTRQSGGGIGTFRDGAFRMALENQVGIIPVILDGTADAVPKGKIILPGKRRIVVKIMNEIPFENIKGKTPKELTREIRELMISELNTLRAIS